MSTWHPSTTSCLHGAHLGLAARRDLNPTLSVSTGPRVLPQEQTMLGRGPLQNRSPPDRACLYGGNGRFVLFYFVEGFRGLPRSRDARQGRRMPASIGDRYTDNNSPPLLSLLAKTPMDRCKAISNMSVGKGNGTRTKYGWAVLSSRLACLLALRLIKCDLPHRLSGRRYSTTNVLSFWGQPSGACSGWSAMDISPPSRFDNLSAPPSMIVPPMPVPCRVRHTPFNPD